jgi:hypothetical protein
MAEGVIGRIDWDDCDRCQHEDAATGCNVDESTWENGLRIEDEFVFCGFFREKKEEEEGDDND